MVNSATVSALSSAGNNALPVERQVYDAARAVAFAFFLKNSRVEPLWRSLTEAADALIAHAAVGSGITVIAVGGYGREELCPHSDIDILLLISAEQGAAAEHASAALLQRLWDLGLRVGHATRTIEETIEAAHADAGVATALLDARLIAGNAVAFRALKKRLKYDVFGKHAPHYIASKLSERDVRHAKWRDSRFVLEPHVKEGKGALRDFQTLHWIDQFSKSKSALLSKEDWRAHRLAFLFLAAVRCHMHIARGRADERLMFDLQMEIGNRMKFPGRTSQQKAEKLMRRYFQCTRLAGTLTRNVCAALEEENLRANPLGFSTKQDSLTLPEAYLLESGRLTFAQANALASKRSRAIELFAIAAEHGLEIHPRAYQTLERNLPELSRSLMFEGEANRSFMQILMGKSPEVQLRRMNEAGILGALIPEFERVCGMMQYDGYHTYTVDEHMLVAVGNLYDIEQGALAEEMPIATQIIHEIVERPALYLAAFCHDLAKGLGGMHAEKGEAVTALICQRMGLLPGETASAMWLVKHQELLSEFAFKRNLEDPQTIVDFVTIVQSPERLRMLLLLTVADIKAVGPTIWNGWKGALMRALYAQAQAAMGVNAPEQRGQALMPEAARVYECWEQQPGKPALAISHDGFHAISNLICCADYSPTVFRNLAGVLAYLGAGIVKAKIHVLGGQAALMMIGIQDVAGHSFAEEEERLQQLPTLLMQAEAEYA